jgi:transcriptional repressor NrdR
MKCPYCSESSHVVDTREVAEAIRRRRECNECSQRFTTYERVAAANLQVVKNDGRREDFSRDKLMGGMQLACVKRPAVSAGPE